MTPHEADLLTNWIFNLRATALAVSPRQLVNDERPLYDPSTQDFPAQAVEGRPYLRQVLQTRN